MDKPSLYLQNRDDIVDRSKFFLENCFPLIRRSESAKKRALDIGCGPGNVTHDVLYPYFTWEIDQMVGIDRSESMVRYARAAYENDKVSFRILDIFSSDLEEYVESFDYVFSFWALHWIQDQQMLYDRIYRLMKPNSDLLVTYVAHSEMYDVYRDIWYRPLYRQYIRDFTGIGPCFQRSKEPTEELREILHHSGFEVRLCKLAKWRMEKTPDFKDFLISINAAYEQLPKHLQESFIMDHIKEMEKRGTFKYQNDFFIDFDMFVVYARKN